MPTIKELQAVCGKPRKDEPWREKLARSISIRITRVLLTIFPSITPNQITVVMMVIGLISAVSFMFGQYFYSLLGVVLYHLYLILDACDGEVARYKKIFSKKGLYLDYMGHVIVNPMILIGIAIGAFMNNPLPIPSEIYLIAGFSAVYFMMLNNFAKLKKYEMYIDKGEFSVVENMQKKFVKEEDQGNRIKNEIQEFFRIMTFNSIFFLGILNLLPYLVLIYGVLFPLQMARRLLAEVSREKN